MDPRIKQCLFLIALFVLLPLLAPAQTTEAVQATSAKQSKPSKRVLAQEITDPVSTLSEIALQNIFIPSTHGSDGYANQLIIEPTLAFPIRNFPDQIIQLTIPVLTTIPEGTNGFGDLELLNVSILARGDRWGAWGLGPAFVFPTATTEQTGAGKWQAGVTTVLAVLAIPNVQIGFVAHNLTSFAGDSARDDVNTLFVEPVFIYHFTETWYVGWGDMTIEFNWENGGAVTFPVNAQVGKLFEFGPVAVDIQLEPFWIPIHDGQTPEWGIQLSLIFPLPSFY